MENSFISFKQHNNWTLCDRTEKSLKRNQVQKEVLIVMVTFIKSAKNEWPVERKFDLIVKTDVIV